MRALYAGALALLVMTGTARVADAQTVDVEAEHQRGMSLRARGHDAEAAELFRGLFERTGEPRALARLGLAEGALLRWSDADEHLRGALDRASDPWVSANRASLEEALRAVERHLGLVSVTCATPGATVQWSGQAPTPLPLPRPLRVATGFIELVVHAPGHLPATRRVAVSAGAEPVVVDVVLVPDRAPTVAATATLIATPSVAAATVRVTPAQTTPARTWQRPLGIGSVVGAGVALGVGVLGVALHESAAASFNGAGCRLYPDRDEVSAGGASCVDDLSATQTAGTMSIVGFVAAGVLGAAGVTALVLSPRATQEPVRVAVDVLPGGRGATAGLSVRF